MLGALAVMILFTTLLGWAYVLVYTLVMRAEPPPGAGSLALASNAAGLALLGTMIGIKQLGLMRRHPQIDVSIIRLGEHDSDPDQPPLMRLQVAATVSIRPGSAPIVVRTINGHIEPLFDAGFSSIPILLKPDPAPLDLSVEQFTYEVSHVPKPSEGHYLRLTLYLVTEDGATVYAAKIRGDGGWREPGILERWRDTRWLRRRERDRRRAWGFP